MPSTVLQLVQRFCGLNGLPIPVTLFGSTLPAEIQLLELFNEVGQTARRKSSWERLTRRTTWLSTGFDDQGLITTRCGVDYDYIVPDTFWNTTLRQKVYGPLSDRQWQELLTMVPSTPLYQYRVQEGRIFVMGPVPDTHTLTLIYKTRNWLSPGVGVETLFPYVTADTNIPVFPDEIMLLGLKAHWLMTKQMAYADQMAMFISAVTDLAGVDDVKAVLDMSNTERKLLPGIFVPSGNWPIS